MTRLDVLWQERPPPSLNDLESLPDLKLSWPIRFSSFVSTWLRFPSSYTLTWCRDYPDVPDSDCTSMDRSKQIDTHLLHGRRKRRNWGRSGFDVAPICSKIPRGKFRGISFDIGFIVFCRRQLTWSLGILCHFGLLLLFTKGVIPFRNRFALFDMLTMLKTTRWSAFTLSTVKLNHRRSRGLQISGLMNRSYSNSEIRSTLPKLPVSNEASKQMCPFFAFPLCPGGRIIILFTFPIPPSVSLSSLSAQSNVCL